MKKKFFKVIALGMLVLAVNSCGEDFVDNPQLGAIPAESYFNDEANAEKAVIGLYDLMQFNYGRDWQSAFFVKILPGDDANAAGGNQDDQTPLQDIDDYKNISSSNAPISSVWDVFYQTISLSNLIIESTSEGNLSNKNLVLAEAKFMRAWSNFELTTMFGAIPLRTATVKSAEEFGLAKSPREAVYTLIEADLKDAIEGLPDKTSVSQPFRVSKGTAQALLGKVLVHQNKHSEAIPYFADVIANPAHDLEKDVNDVWTQKADYGIESLFEIGYISTEAYNWDGNVEWGGRVESNLHVQLMGPRASDAGGPGFDVTGSGLINGWGFNLPTAKLIKAFETAGDVKRKAATLKTEEDIVADGGTVIKGDEIWDYEGAIRTKYATRLSETVSDGIAELNYSTNWKVFRYAEVLLLAAEAYNKNGQDGEALIELNKIRMRAGLPDLVGLAGDNLFEAIVDEKFLELSHEGQRFWDLVRWGKAAAELAGTNYTPKNNLFPIPASEINLNPLLSQADQNPGY